MVDYTVYDSMTVLRNQKLFLFNTVDDGVRCGTVNVLNGLCVCVGDINNEQDLMEMINGEKHEKLRFGDQLLKLR